MLRKLRKTVHGRWAAVLVVFALLTGLGVMSMAAAPRPTRGTTSGGHQLFHLCDPCFQNYVVDRPVLQLPVFHNAIVASLVGHGTGTPAVAEINTSEIAGLTLDADNESFSTMIMVPHDIDWSKDADIRVTYSNSEAAATGTIDFVITYTAITADTTALAVGATAMDTDGGAEADVAANVIGNSPWSTITGGTLSLVPTDDYLVVKAKVDLTTAANATVYGFQFRYYRKYL